MAWTDKTEKGGGSQDFWRLKSGEKARIHIVSDEPFIFKTYWDEKQKKSFNFPATSFIKELMLRIQYAFVVLLEEEVEDVPTVVAKVFCMGKKLKEQIADVYTAYGNDFSKVDFIISRTGEKLKTCWTAVPVPAKGMKYEGDLPKMDKLIKMATKEDLAGKPKDDDENDAHEPA